MIPFAYNIILSYYPVVDNQLTGQIPIEVCDLHLITLEVDNDIGGCLPPL